MATPLSADKIVSALKAEGVTVKEYRSWRTHNRDDETGKTFGPVNGVMIHHTAGTNSLELCYEGRSDLPGPLSHSHLAKGGTVTMVGHGRANHAGSIAQNAHDAVVAESSTHPEPDTSEPVDGNDKYYGLEIENLGDGDDPYPDVQYDAAVRWAAALCRAHGWSADSVIGHKEGTTRKIDPSFGMNAFRERVAERLAHDADYDPEEDDVPSADEIAKAVWTYPYEHGGSTLQAKSRLGRAQANSLDAEEHAAEAAELAGQAVALLEAQQARPRSVASRATTTATSPGDVLTSLMRTLTPLITTGLLTVAAVLGLDLDSATVTVAVYATMYAVYYTGLRLVETWATARGVTWLATVAGVMLGWAVTPSYSAS